MSGEIDESCLLELKEKGNSFFKNGEYGSAVIAYSTAISSTKCHTELKSTLLSNRAACYSKLGNMVRCKEDCDIAIELSPSNTKAWFRRALAHEAIGDLSDAFRDVTMLLNIEKTNKDGLTLARRLRVALEKEKANDSEMNRILTKMRAGERITDGMKAIISLCVDHKSHAHDFIRKGGMIWLSNYYQSKRQYFHAVDSKSSSHDIDPDSLQQISLSIRVLSSICNYAECVKLTTKIKFNDDNYSQQFLSDTYRSCQLNPIMSDEFVIWEHICVLIANSNYKQVVEGIVAVVIKTMQSFPVVGDPPYLVPPPLPPSKEKEPSAEVEQEEEEHSTERVEELNDDGSSKAKKSSGRKPNRKQRPLEPDEYEPNLYLRARPVKLFVASLGKAIELAIRSKTHEVLSMCVETFTAFISDTPDYITSHRPVIDVRSEAMEDRKERFRIERLYRCRSKSHATWSIEAGILGYLVPGLEMPQSTERQKIAVGFARLCTALDDDEALKTAVKPYLAGADAVIEGDSAVYSESNRPPGMELCRQRAAVTAALFLSKPDVAAWALGLPGGVPQLLLLISAGDVVCQEISAEVLCLCSSTENGAPLLASVVSSGALHALLRSTVAATRAAAASTLTKLSLKAKAIKDDNDDEVTVTLNVVLDVIREAVEENRNPKNNSSSIQSSSGGAGKAQKSQLVSFSSVDLDAKETLATATAQGGLATSTERAIEVLASMAARTAIKEELVHGSYRMSAAVTSIIALAGDAARLSNTACYGLAHILCSLTVTNYELQLAALAEKEMTPDQYKQLKSLSRVKTKDESGQEISEPEEPDDTDTDQLRNIRIRKLVSYDAIPAIIRLMGDSESLKAKETAARALRQLCTELSARGPVIQQGGLTACYKLVGDDLCEKAARLEAAHVVAKTLITTNPAALPDHVRLGAIQPLLFACRHVDASNLLQFEACMSLTNLVSFGAAEQDKMVADKGVSAVHYLMFSDHFSVRRAATEVLCNMATNEALLSILRVPEKLRLWLSLTDDLDNEDNEEAEATSRAASGTLAMAAADELVCEAMMKENSAEIFTRVLSMHNNDVNHRVLVTIKNMFEKMSSKNDIATKFMEAGIIAVFSELLKLSDTSDVVKELVQEVAVGISQIVS